MNDTKESPDGNNKQEAPGYKIEDGVVARFNLASEAFRNLDLVGDYGDASMIEAARKLEQEHGLDPQKVRLVGFYDHEGVRYPVVSFMYHKVSSQGIHESDERVVAVTGWSKDKVVHPDHKGQEPAIYLVGIQIGVSPKEGGYPTLDKKMYDGGVIEAKSFSTDCIFGGPLGDNPVLANSHGEVKP